LTDPEPHTIEETKLDGSVNATSEEEEEEEDLGEE